MPHRPKQHVDGSLVRDVLEDARDLAENLRAALEHRGVIEQAKGILMERHRLTGEQAFRLLAEASMHTNRKLRDVAEDLARTGELRPATPSPGTRGQPQPPVPPAE